MRQDNDINNLINQFRRTVIGNANSALQRAVANDDDTIADAWRLLKINKDHDLNIVRLKNVENGREITTQEEFKAVLDNAGKQLTMHYSDKMRNYLEQMYGAVALDNEMNYTNKNKISRNDMKKYLYSEQIKHFPPLQGIVINSPVQPNLNDNDRKFRADAAIMNQFFYNIKEFLTINPNYIDGVYAALASAAVDSAYIGSDADNNQIKSAF